MPDTDPARDIQRLATPPARMGGAGAAARGRPLRLLAFYATPPVFDGPEDRNGRRNHDEAAFWLRLLEGDLPMQAPAAALRAVGQTNLDPQDGDGRREALRRCWPIRPCKTRHPARRRAGTMRARQG
jgi:hypothetical protein